MSSLQYMIDVMTAARDGKKIQWRDRNAAGTYPWADSKKLSWDWTLFDYRIAPEPRKPREWYVSVGTIADRTNTATHWDANDDPRFWEKVLVREVLPEDK